MSISKENYTSSLDPSHVVRDALEMKLLRSHRKIFGMMALLWVASGLCGKVVVKEETYFQVQSIIEVKAPLDVSFETFQKIGSWWNPSHTFEGNASNYRFNLEKQALVENIEGGFVRHMDIVYWKPRSRVILKGGLGPLLTEAVNGILIIDFKQEGEISTVAMKYTVSGRTHQGSLAEWATAVDYVLDEQLQRLKVALSDELEE